MIYNPFLVWMEFAVMMSVSGGKKLNYTKGSAFLRNLYISCRDKDLLRHKHFNVF